MALHLVTARRVLGDCDNNHGCIHYDCAAALGLWWFFDQARRLFIFFSKTWSLIYFALSIHYISL